MDFSHACTGTSIQELDITTTLQDQHNRHQSRNDGIAHMLMIPPALFCIVEDSPARLQRKRRENIEQEHSTRCEDPRTYTTPPPPPPPGRMRDLAEEAIALLRESNRNNIPKTRNGGDLSNYNLQQ